MNNNDINKIIEDIKYKIEECIKYLKQEKYSEVEQKLKEINDIYAQNLNIINGRDITNKLQEKYSKEMKEFDEQFKININNMDVKTLSEVSICLYKLFKDKIAMQYFEKVMNVEKNDIEVLYMMAERLRILGAVEISRKIFQQILKINIDYDNTKELYYKGMSHLYLSWEITKGIRCFKRILEIGTDNIDILFDIGKNLFYLKQNYYEYAKKYFERILEIDTNNLEVLFNTGVYLYRLWELEKGLDCFEKVLNNTNDIGKLCSMAMELRKLGEQTIVNEYFDKILDIPENDEKDIVYKGSSAYFLYRDDKAKDCFKRVLESSTNDISILNIAGNKLYELKEDTYAKKCLKKIFLMDIGNINILGNAGEKLYRLGESKEVIERLNEIVININDIKNIYYLANILQRLGEYNEAQKYYQKIWNIGLSNKNDIQELNIMAMAAKFLNKKDDAKKYFKEILNTNIQDISLLYDMGWQLKELEEDCCDNECFQKILELDNMFCKDYTTEKILFIKGMSAKFLNKKDDAKKYFNDILKTNVQDIDMLYGVGVQLNQLNESKSAQQCFKRISNSNNYDENNIYLLYEKGVSECLLQNTDGAMKYFKKILSKIEEIKDTQFLIGMGNTMLKLKKKKEKEAEKYFEVILKVDSKMEFDYANKGIAYLALQKLEKQDSKKNNFELDSKRNYWEVIKKYSEELKKDNEKIDYKKLQNRIFTYNVFSPFVSEFLDKNNHSEDENNHSGDEYLYHYTGINGLKGILENKELWVTKSEFLNDPTEISYIKDVVDNIKTNIQIEKISEKINKFYDKKYKENDNDKKDVYVLSMSTEQDSLPMWSNYSKGDGYNIQFNKQNLKNKFMEQQSYIPHTYGRVKYIDKKDKEKVIYNLIKSICESAEKNNVEKDVGKDIVIETILANIRMIALFVKHTGFKYENEYRFVFIPHFWKCNNVSRYSVQQDSDTNRDVNIDKNENNNKSYTNENVEYGFRTSKGVLIPYIKIPIDKNINESLITKIFTSPTSDENLTKQGIEDFYRLKCGNGKIDVDKSEIPLRDI